MTPNPATDVVSVPPLDGPFAAVLTGDDAAIAAFELDEDIATELLAQATDPPLARLLADTPRPMIEAGAHPIRLCLHAVARQVQHDGLAPDLGANFLEALDACMHRGNLLWADQSAALWNAWVLHESEAAKGWHAARIILQRHADVPAPPRLLATFATMAERAGELAEAGLLWARALEHPDVVTSAQTRWLVEFQWARSYLMLSGGQPGRAVFVLERVHAGIAAMRGSVGRLLLIDVTLELAFFQILIGRPQAALDVIARTRGQLVVSAEYEAWLHGVEGLAHAVLGSVDAARAELALATRAESDTSSLELSATLPALMLVEAIVADTPAVEAAIRRGRVLLGERTPDAEQRLIWIYFAVLGMQLAGNVPRARELAAELATLTMEHRAALPVYAALGGLLVGHVLGEAAVLERSRAELLEQGFELGAQDADPWQILDETTRGAAPVRVPSVRIEVLGGLRVLVDGEPVDPALWSKRRKARVVLAVLVASGGRIERGVLVEGLWYGIDMTQAQASARLSTVLSVVRTVLGADAGDGTELRSVAARDLMVELVLAEGDSSDVGDLRRIAADVAALDPRNAAGSVACATRLVPLADGIPLAGLGGDEIIVTWQRRLRDEIVETSLAVLRAWIAAAAPSSEARVDVPQVLLTLAAALVRLDPLDEQVAACEIELHVRAGRLADGSTAFHRYREALQSAVGLTPSLALVRRHAELVEPGT
ncbi:MAG: hypothetical protein JWM25_1589 [Thermoleophilia bacterium]|nr:hypothetical protein [Thermoleophilia bacterium]